MRLYLDDMRDTPVGFMRAKTAQEAIELLQTGRFTYASLDHDLGACAVCLKGRTPEQWLEEHNYTAMPNCEHFGTGYTVVCFLEEHPELWPVDGVSVHSANPVGSARMRQVIEKHYGRNFYPLKHV